MTIEKVPTIIAALCVLHNICKLYQEGYDEKWSEMYQEGYDEKWSEIVRQASEDSPQPHNSNSVDDGGAHHVPQAIRNGLILHFKNHPIA